MSNLFIWFHHQIDEWEMGNGQCFCYLHSSIVVWNFFLQRNIKKKKLFNSEPGQTDTDNNRQFPLVCSFGEEKNKTKTEAVANSHSESLSGALTIKIGKLQTV